MVLKRTMNFSKLHICRDFFVNNIIDWFNTANNSKFAPTIEE